MKACVFSHVTGTVAGHGIGASECDGSHILSSLVELGYLDSRFLAIHLRPDGTEEGPPSWGQLDVASLQRTG